MTPEALRVCSESREVTLKSYQWFEHLRADGSVECGYYVNFSSNIFIYDLVYMGREPEFQPWSEQVQKLAVLKGFYKIQNHTSRPGIVPSNGLEVLAALLKVREIAFLVDSRSDGWIEELNYRWGQPF